MRVVGAPQMISQVSSIFTCSPLPSGTCELQACSFPGVVFPPPPLSALSSSPSHCALQDGFGQTLRTYVTSLSLPQVHQQTASIGLSVSVFLCRARAREREVPRKRQIRRADTLHWNVNAQVSVRTWLSRERGKSVFLRLEEVLEEFKAKIRLRTDKAATRVRERFSRS